MAGKFFTLEGRESWLRAHGILSLGNTVVVGCNSRALHLITSNTPADNAPDVITRQTRSGRGFSAWDGSYLTLPTSCDLKRLVQESISRGELVETDPLTDDEYPKAAWTIDSGSEQPNSHVPPLQRTSNPTALTKCTPPKPPPATADVRPGGTPAKKRKIAVQKKKGHKNRSKKRKEAQQSSFSHHVARPKALAKFVHGACVVTSSAAVEDAHVASTAYVGLPERKRDTNIYALEDLVGPDSQFQFKLVHHREGAPIPIVSGDADQYIIGVIAGAPLGDDWDQLARDAADLLDDARHQCDVPEHETKHRRGNFTTLTCGVSHGNGRTEPKNIRNREKEAEVARALNEQKPFVRLAGFATSIMAAWAPNLYQHYVDKLGMLHAKSPHLKRNFPTSGSVFAATTYNLGPQTTCCRHTDCLNLPFGWCAITALGNYDYTKGGHLVLWEARLVIEFPPGTTILVPSAIISHSNVPIGQEERRFSFTQYSAGGLFRWVDHGFRKASAFWASLTEQEMEVETEKAQNRWIEGLGLWTKLSDLKKPM